MDALWSSCLLSGSEGWRCTLTCFQSLLIGSLMTNPLCIDYSGILTWIKAGSETLSFQSLFRAQILPNERKPKEKKPYRVILWNKNNLGYPWWLLGWGGRIKLNYCTTLPFAFKMSSWSYSSLVLCCAEPQLVCRLCSSRVTLQDGTICWTKTPTASTDYLAFIQDAHTFNC